MHAYAHGLSLAAALALSGVVACSDTDIMSSHQHGPNPALAARVSGAVASDVAQLRRLVGPLHQLDAAQAAGFDTPLSECVASPDGAMGFHWGYPSRIDAVVNADEPEVLVFSPSPDGVRLGAVEYIVPRALSAEAPVLFGETFVPGGPGNSLWTLHVWIGIQNPDGLFAPWNPRVECPA